MTLVLSCQERNSERLSTWWEMTGGSTAENQYTSSGYSLLRSSMIYSKFSTLLNSIKHLEVTFMAKKKKIRSCISLFEMLYQNTINWVC